MYVQVYTTFGFFFFLHAFGEIKLCSSCLHSKHFTDSAVPPPPPPSCDMSHPTSGSSLPEVPDSSRSRVLMGWRRWRKQETDIARNDMGREEESTPGKMQAAAAASYAKVERDQHGV